MGFIVLWKAFSKKFFKCKSLKALFVTFTRNKASDIQYVWVRLFLWKQFVWKCFFICVAILILYVNLVIWNGIKWAYGCWFKKFFPWQTHIFIVFEINRKVVFLLIMYHWYILQTSRVFGQKLRMCMFAKSSSSTSCLPKIFFQHTAKFDGILDKHAKYNKRAPYSVLRTTSRIWSFLYR